MAVILPQTIEITSRHQVHLERLKTGEARKYADFLKAMQRVVLGTLAADDITEFGRRRAEALITSIRADLAVIGLESVAGITESALDLAEYEADFEARSLAGLGVDFKVPAADQLRSAVLTSVLNVRGPDQGKLLQPFLKDYTARQLDLVSGAIRQGYYQGQTTPQITRAVRDVLGTIGDGGQYLTRTALQHAAVQSREAVWYRNKDIVKRVRWSSTLDGKTSPQCRTLDGQEYPINEGPRPPIHINCRSSMVPVLDDAFAELREGATRFSRTADGVEYVPASQNYYQWLKNQPAGFIDSAIGSTRGKLLRNGGLSAQRFAELQLGRNFEPLTLVQMRELDPLAFEAANL